MTILSSKTRVVRERVFNANSVEDVVHVITEMSAVRHTGPVVINMGQGSVRSIHVEDAALVDQPKVDIVVKTPVSLT